MKTFIFLFEDKLYKATGKHATSILASMFTTDQLYLLGFKGWEEV